MNQAKPSYVVLHEVAEGDWRLIGVAERHPGQTARRARAQAVADALGHEPENGERYTAILRSEWRIGTDW